MPQYIMPQKLKHIPLPHETPHTADPHHAEVFPETTVDLNCLHHTNTTTKHQQDCLPALIEQPGKPKTGNISRSPLMIHHLSTIASNEQASDSEDDLN